MPKFNKNILKIEANVEATRISIFIRKMTSEFHKKGVVIGLSGGIDSALCAALCVKALGKSKVLGLILPEKESNPLSKDLAIQYAKHLGIEFLIEDITSVLDECDVYHRKNAVVNRINPDCSDKYRYNIALPTDLLVKDALNYFTLNLITNRGKEIKTRLKPGEVREITAASNIKQRIRMVYLYYQAEKLNYLVCGTTNKAETVQGYFVKYGDGGVDIEPIAHLYKTQVFQLAKFLNVDKKIVDREPSPDTYSLPITDEQMYFRMQYHDLDLLLYAWENCLPIQLVTKVMQLDEIQIRRAYRDFESKKRTTKYLGELPASLSTR